MFWTLDFTADTMRLLEGEPSTDGSMGNTSDSTGRSMGNTSDVTRAGHCTWEKLARFGWNKKMTHVRSDTVV